MSPIEEHFVKDVTSRLAGFGIQARVEVLSASAEDWAFRIRVVERLFEAGFDHRQQLWCHERMGEGDRQLQSNDAPQVPTSIAARDRALELIAAAVAHPDWAPRNPPVI